LNLDQELPRSDRWIDRIVALRQQFPYVDRYAYFNFGGQGLMPQGAIEAIQAAQEYLQQIAPFSNAAGVWIDQEIAALRGAIAAELGTTAETITLTEDTTVGCNIALWGLDWQAGDHLLLTDCEHQGIVATVQELQHRFGIEVSICPLQTVESDAAILTAFQSCFRPKTRLVVLSHILWNTGQVLPLEQIVALCHGHGCQILVDAAQSVGVLPLDLTKLQADFYAFTGHKWWCGAAGVGGLYVRPEAQVTLRPTFIGWRGIQTDFQNRPTGWALGGKRYEVATAAIPLYPGLRKAIATHQAFGSAAERYQLMCDRSHALWTKLQTLSQVKMLRQTPPASGLVAFQCNHGQHRQLVATLERQGIFIRLLLDPNCVRACTHYFTLDREIDQLVEAIAQFPGT
jgi:L-cysteine/cystine lyase